MDDLMEWVTLTRRTTDPKLAYFESVLKEEGILSRRHGESFHAPIMQVPNHDHDDAYVLLTCDLFGDGRIFDDIADDDPVFRHLM